LAFIQQKLSNDIVAHMIQTIILDWYKTNKRNLPWRHTTNPYHILVSEMMLQQTQVDRVIPKYKHFLQTFPTLQALANTSPAEVINEWAGLGYNRRALYLHKFARAVVDKFAGKIPDNREQLMTLPGIGPYTSQAIRCFAFGKDVEVVDINIKRIYSRIFFRGEGSGQELQNIARHLIPTGKGVEWNNALMDFGSMVCTDVPKCTSCPLTEQCSAYKAGTPEKYVKPKQQSKFIGSNRYYRSLVIKELRKDKEFSSSIIGIKKLKPKEKTDEWFNTIIESLENDGLIVRKNDTLSLPK